MLTQTRLRELLDYDPATGVFTRKVSRGNRATGAIAGSFADAGTGYLCIWVEGRSYLAHHLAVLWMTGVLPGQIDHKNGDGMDNRWENLRPASNAENAQNRRRHRNNSSGFKGVSYRRDNDNWAAYINKDGKRFHLGFFGTAEQAARARDEAAERLHGAFARLNTA